MNSQSFGKDENPKLRTHKHNLKNTFNKGMKLPFSVNPELYVDLARRIALGLPRMQIAS